MKNNEHDSTAVAPLIPAATIILLKDTSEGLKILMLRRNKQLRSFAGAWVFPGGRVDDEDAPGEDEVTRAKTTAIRETFEETGLDIRHTSLLPFSYWIPPIQEKRRFSTWFFVGEAPEGDVKIDRGEIHDFRWTSPASLLAQIPDPNLHIMPPTYVSLWEIAKFDNVKSCIDQLRNREIERFETKFFLQPDRFVTVWQGDSAYEDGLLDKDGPRHRLVAEKTKWDYQKTS